MSQAQLNMQTLHSKLEQHTNNTDLTPQPLFTDSPVLFLKATEQESSIVNSDRNSSKQNNSNIEQNNHQTSPEKQQIFPAINTYEKSHGNPPNAKTRYEIMKHSAFLSSPIYPPI